MQLTPSTAEPRSHVNLSTCSHGMTFRYIILTFRRLCICEVLPVSHASKQHSIQTTCFLLSTSLCPNHIPSRTPRGIFRMLLQGSHHPSIASYLVLKQTLLPTSLSPSSRVILFWCGSDQRLSRRSRALFPIFYKVNTVRHPPHYSVLRIIWGTNFS